MFSERQLSENITVSNHQILYGREKLQKLCNFKITQSELHTYFDKYMSEHRSIYTVFNNCYLDVVVN